MGTIRVVWGAATGPTAMASYDAALAEANVHDYNLVRVSSVIPAGATLDVAGEAPDFGPAGERLTVVQSRDTVALEENRPAVAGIGWARSADQGPGIFYEAAGEDEVAVREGIDAGLDHGAGLRDWTVAERGIEVRASPASSASDASNHSGASRPSEATDSFRTQVVCAIYGDAEPIL
ncbi:MAG: pyruvoyl-dependent arginine decarboxylase [Haloarculaceae archaeon]